MKIPLSLYIHMPWCERKCPYCDFNSHAIWQKAIPEDAYITALLNDFEHDFDWINGRSFQSIFIGGGTPSLFSGQAIDRLLFSLASKNIFSHDIEMTLEANPGSSEQQRFAQYRQAGINRLSIGVQSFQDEKLKRLGRIHDSNNAKHALDSVREAGFENFNVDLMFALPGQTVADALSDLQTALSFDPPHLSWYQLTLEPDTHFYKRPPQLPNDELSWEIQKEGQALLKEHGYIHYEVSAYAKPLKQCRHNRHYWEFGDYLGIGAGAHGKLTHDEGAIIRTSKIRNPKLYLDAKENYMDECKQVTKTDIPFEFMLNALRLNQPIQFSLFKERTGLPIESIKASLFRAKEKGLLIVETDFFETTAFGKLYLNDLLEIFI